MFIKNLLILFKAYYTMSAIKSISKQFQNEPSVFALLVDNISQMSKAEQKLLWIKLNKKKLLAEAKEINASIKPNNLTEDEINDLVKEARTYARKKKKS